MMGRVDVLKMFSDYHGGPINGWGYLFLLALGGLFFFCVGIAPLKNDIEAASLHGNICIKEIEGAILEEKPRSLIMKYTMQSEKFDIFCYNELVADMNSQKVSNIWVSIYASSAIIRWNEKEYFFTRPDKSLVITDSNVSTLLKEGE